VVRDRDTLQATIAAQNLELKELKASNIKVTIERDSAEKKVTVFKVQVTESKHKIAKLEKDFKVCETAKVAAEHQVEDLSSELTALKEALQAQKEQQGELTQHFQSIIRDLEEQLRISEAKNVRLEIDIEVYLEEIRNLNAKLSGDKRFMQFVTVKREVNNLKDHNLVLQHKINEQECLLTMPVMKKSGKISIQGSRVKSADIRRGFGKPIESNIVVRCISAKLRPPTLDYM
jgi:chromosome segregation ATPase